MADEAASGGGEGTGPKEIEGFKITRAAPTEDKPPVMAFAIVIVLMIVGVGVAWKLSSGGDEGDGTEATTGAVDGATDGAAVKTYPPDVEVPDEVWDRIEFLESEGNLEKALDYADEQHGFTPNSELRAKMQELRSELGIDVPDETFTQALVRARAAFNKKDWEETFSAADAAVELSEDEDDLGEPFFLRGVARGYSEDKPGGVEDLEAAIEEGYPEGKVNPFLEQFQE